MGINILTPERSNKDGNPAVVAQTESWFMGLSSLLLIRLMELYMPLKMMSSGNLLMKKLL